MRTLLVTIAAAMISLNAAAYNTGKDPGDYCVESINGKTRVEYNGYELTKAMRLEDGTKVKPNGTIVFASGKRVKLRTGECVNENNLDLYEDRRGVLAEKISNLRGKKKSNHNRSDCHDNS